MNGKSSFFSLNGKSSFFYSIRLRIFDFELVMMPPFSLSYLGPDYEWDVGHFEGAQRPNVDCFRSTSFGLSGEVIILCWMGPVCL